MIEPYIYALRHDDDLEERLMRRPVCCCCKEHIQSDVAINTPDGYYCPECEEQNASDLWWTLARQDYLERLDK